MDEDEIVSILIVLIIGYLCGPIGICIAVFILVCGYFLSD